MTPQKSVYIYIQIYFKKNQKALKNKGEKQMRTRLKTRNTAKLGYANFGFKHKKLTFARYLFFLLKSYTYEQF